LPRSPAYPSFPSVTEVLHDVGLTRTYPDTRAMLGYRQRGSALHKAIELYHRGTLDLDTVHESIRPSFDKYQEFEVRHGFVMVASEVELIHPQHRYIGHLDLVGIMDGDLALIDVKMSDSPDPASTYQLAAYAMLWGMSPLCAQHGVPKRNYVLPLGKNVKPRPIDVTDEYAVNVWLAALTVWWAKQGGRR